LCSENVIIQLLQHILLILAACGEIRMFARNFLFRDYDKHAGEGPWIHGETNRKRKVMLGRL